MVNSWQALLSFIRQYRGKQAGYILLSSIVVLLLVSTVIVYQYHYYSGYHQLAERLYQEYLMKIHDNIKLVKKVLS